MNDTTADTDMPEIGIAWGDDISEERQSELNAILDAWEAESDHGERRSPFDSVHLSGADVF